MSDASQQSEKNTQLVLNFQMAVAKQLQGEPQPSIADYLSDDIQWHLPASMNELAEGSDKQGKAEVLRLFDDIVKRFYQPKTMAFDFHGITASHDKVHFHFTLTATTNSQQTYQSGYQLLFRVEDDLVREVWEYFDSATLLALV